jgi:hypothetical protein
MVEAKTAISASDNPRVYTLKSENVPGSPLVVSKEVPPIKQLLNVVFGVKCVFVATAP